MTENSSLPAVESHDKSPSRSRRHRQRGSEILEFTLVLMPMLMCMFLILDIAWAVYSRSTLQYAVGQGIRYAVTSQTIGTMGLRASVQTVVQENAFGRLNSTAGAATGVDGWNSIYVDCYLVSTTGSLTSSSNCGITASGQLPLVEVSVAGISSKAFMPTLRLPGLGADFTPILMAAVAWDRMEAPPLTGTPAM